MSSVDPGPSAPGEPRPVRPGQEPEGGSPPPDGAKAPAEGGRPPTANRFTKQLRRLGEANAAVVTVLAVFSALVLGAVLILVTTPAVLHAWGSIGSAPGAAFSLTFHTIANAYSAMFEGSIFSPSAVGHAISTGQGWTAVFTPISETLVSATPLILAGVGVAIGFSTGVFNIGAQGQLIGGALAALFVGFELHVTIWLHLPLVILAGAVGGGAIGFIPGILKAKTGAHEVITTIMLNYIVLDLLVYLLTTAPFQQPGQSNAISRIMPGSARLPHLFGSGLRVNAGLIVAVAVVFGAAWFTRRSTVGFSFRVIGLNPDAGRTAGMDTKKATILVLTLSGALAGLAGMATLSGTDFFVSSGYGGDIGFYAITVALLGRNRPWGVFLGSLLFAALDTGGRSMQAATGIDLDLTTVIQAIIVFMVATPLLVREVYRLKDTGSSLSQVLSKGWSG
jgi:general nucleoside transport system permease protein